MSDAVQARRLILASGSPARLSTLRAAGIEPEVIVSGVDEDGVDTDTPSDHALILARRKALAVARTVTGAPALVLGCDSILELDGEIYGKPASPAEACTRWRRMQARTGILHTGHCVIETDTGRTSEATAATTVHFAAVSDEEIEAYVATGEPLNVAGAFTVDGLGGPFVESVEGDYHNVVGLSLPLLRRLLADLGVFWPDLWNRPT
ncbi:Maf family protein [Actinopolymorpha alba]|uniref:Maf family protein n=1 Tax=Actinopolymorpha alba TaxID=533267 RepID=UPI0003642B60|nr:nucleoside triphosphate pyrophosphatase [Actinopolymorpha alba]